MDNSFSFKFLNKLNIEEKNKLKFYIKKNPFITFPYSNLEYNNIITNNFNYKNYSFIVFNINKDIVGYLPQWLDNKKLISVPWRDRGGPLFENSNVLKYIININKNIITNNKNISCFVWKDFKTEYLQNYKYYINLYLSLNFSITEYYNNLNSKIKNKINQAKKNHLIFNITNDIKISNLKEFYKIFLINRKLLGVPAYSFNFFSEFIINYKNKIYLSNILHQNNVISSSLLLAYNKKVISLFSCSLPISKKLKSNDFMNIEIINFLYKKGYSTYDFGSDSPLQSSLINYKLKWGAKKRHVKYSYYGNYKIFDHNLNKYIIYKKIIRYLPMALYKLLSKIIIK